MFLLLLLLGWLFVVVGCFLFVGLFVVVFLGVVFCFVFVLFCFFCAKDVFRRLVPLKWVWVNREAQGSLETWKADV